MARLDAIRGAQRQAPAGRTVLPWLGVPGAALVVVALHLLRLDLLSLGAMPIVVALVLPMASTFCVRLVVAVGLCYSIDCVVALLAGLVGIPFVPMVAVLAVVLPIIIAAALGWAQVRLGSLIDGGDAIALLTGLAVLMLLWLPSAKDHTAEILGRLVSNGEDNAAHLGIVQALTVQQGLLFGDAQRWAGRVIPGHTAYPPGFHLNLALIVAALENLFGGPNPRHLVRAYFYAGIALQAIWATTTLIAIRALAGARRSSSTAMAVLGLAVVLFFLFGPPAALRNWGFQPQVAALWILVLLVLIAATPGLDDRPLLRFGLALLAVVGITWSWYLVSPAAGMVVLALIWLQRSVLIKHWATTLISLTTAAALSALPLYLAARAGAPAYINGHGAVVVLDRVFIAMLVVAAVASVLLPSHIAGRTGRTVNFAAFVGAAALAVGIYWYQIRTAGEAGYFFEKSLYTVAILATLGAGAVVLVCASAGLGAYGVSAWRRMSLGLLGALLVWLSTAVVTQVNPGRMYLSGTWIFTDVGALQHLLTAPPPGDGRQVLFWSDTPPVDDYLTNRFAAAIYLRNTDARNDFAAENGLHQDDRKLLQLVRASPSGLRLVTRDPNLRERLVAVGFTPADMQRLEIETFGGAMHLSTGTPTSYDISAGNLRQVIFPARPR